MLHIEEVGLHEALQVNRPTEDFREVGECHRVDIAAIDLLARLMAPQISEAFFRRLEKATAPKARL